MKLFRLLRLQFFSLFVVFLIRIAIESLPEPFRSNVLISRAVSIAIIFIIASAGYRLVRLVGQWNVLTETLSPAMLELLQKILKLGVLSLALLITIDSLGISITPILASLGVGSIAVALALQDTLGNVFSGVYILIDQPLSIGDFIRLEGGIEGVVTQIGWRSTHLQMGASDTVVIPNTKLASSILMNFSLPKPETAVVVMLEVGYDCDLERAEKIVQEVADEVQATVPGAVRGFAAGVQFQGFLESGISVQATLRAATHSDRGLVRHLFMKRVKKAFDDAGISIAPRLTRRLINELN